MDKLIMIKYGELSTKKDNIKVLHEFYDKFLLKTKKKRRKIR